MSWSTTATAVGWAVLHDGTTAVLCRAEGSSSGCWTAAGAANGHSALSGAPEGPGGPEAPELLAAPAWVGGDYHSGTGDLSVIFADVPGAVECRIWVSVNDPDFASADLLDTVTATWGHVWPLAWSPGDTVYVWVAAVDGDGQAGDTASSSITRY